MEWRSHQSLSSFWARKGCDSTCSTDGATRAPAHRVAIFLAVMLELRCGRGGVGESDAVGERGRVRVSDLSRGILCGVTSSDSRES